MYKAPVGHFRTDCSQRPGVHHHRLRHHFLILPGPGNDLRQDGERQVKPPQHLSPTIDAKGCQVPELAHAGHALSSIADEVSNRPQWFSPSPTSSASRTRAHFDSILPRLYKADAVATAHAGRVNHAPRFLAVGEYVPAFHNVIRMPGYRICPANNRSWGLLNCTKLFRFSCGIHLVPRRIFANR